MPHVLVAGRIHEAGLSLLRSAPGVTLDLVDEVSTESYAPIVDRADAVLIRTQPMPGSVIRAAARLKIVSRHGVGYDAVDVTALSAREIPLAVVGDVNSGPVAEHTMMLILALAKRTLLYDRSARNGGWAIRNTFGAVELENRKLLLLGFGRIGRRVAKLADAFGMEVMAYDPFVDEAAIRADGVVPAPDLGLALEAADVVSVHIPMSQRRALIGAAEFARMKPSAFIVNTARGGLIDEGALVAALAEGRVAGAGLDVFEAEPPTAGAAFFDSDRVVLSPHSAGLTDECAARMSIAAARNILDFFEGRLDPRLVINPSVLKR